MPECKLDARIQAKTGRELETTLQDPTALLDVTPLVSYILNAWEHIKGYSCTYRALLIFANIGRSSRKRDTASPQKLESAFCTLLTNTTR